MCHWKLGSAKRSLCLSGQTSLQLQSNNCDSTLYHCAIHILENAPAKFKSWQTTFSLGFVPTAILGMSNVSYLSTTSEYACSHVICMTVVAVDIGADGYCILRYISSNFLHPMSVIWHASCLTHLSKTSPSVQNVPPAMSRVPCGVKESPLCINWVSVCQPFVRNISAC